MPASDPSATNGLKTSDWRARRIRDVVDELQLNLEGLVVGTEAATGPFAWTAALAAAAGAAEVRVVAQGGAYGTVDDAVRETYSVLRTVCSTTVLRVTSRAEALQADVVTNLGPLRPFDAASVAGMRAGTGLPLMWETWEWRPEELDLRACRERSVLVLGTNESHPAVRTMSYVGMIPLKLLLNAGEAVVGQKIAIVGTGAFTDHMSMALERAGAVVRIYSDPRNLGDWLPEAIVFADHESTDLLVGPGGRLSLGEFAARVGNAIVVHVSGHVDADGLRAEGLRLVPDRIARGARRMSVTTGYLGVEPVLRLHGAGLAVGAALSRAWQDTRVYQRALTIAKQMPLAQDFSPAQWNSAGLI
jgi:hypothetical protein